MRKHLCLENLHEVTDWGRAGNAEAAPWAGKAQPHPPHQGTDHGNPMIEDRPCPNQREELEEGHEILTGDRTIP